MMPEQPLKYDKVENNSFERSSEEDDDECCFDESNLDGRAVGFGTAVAKSKVLLNQSPLTSSDSSSSIQIGQGDDER
jgi:hypothetical protein